MLKGVRGCTANVIKPLTGPHILRVGCVAHLREAAIKEFITALIKGLDSQVRGCVRHRLRCRDPPAVTSTFLRLVLGFSEFRVKRFWRVARSLAGYKLTVYRLRDAQFHLVPTVRRGPVFVLSSEPVFLDVFDSMKHRCIEYPNENAFYLYIEGELGGEALRINTVYVLKKLFEVRPRCYETIINSIERIIEGDTIKGILGFTCIFKVLRDYSNLLADVLPVIPRSLSELALLSPVVGSVINEVARRAEWRQSTP